MNLRLLDADVVEAKRIADEQFTPWHVVIRRAVSVGLKHIGLKGMRKPSTLIE